MNYTKGPWQLSFENDEYMEWKIEAVSNEELVDDFEIEEDGKWHISASRQPIEIASRLADEPFYELEANMRLMAASPDLFETCVFAYQALKSRKTENQLVLKRLEKSIRKALLSDMDVEGVYEQLKEENCFDYKDYFLFPLEDEHFLFHIDFARNEEEEESSYGFIFDQRGNFVEEEYSLSNDIEYHNLQRVKDELKKSEIENLNIVSRFLKCNMPYVQGKEAVIEIQKAKADKQGFIDIAFFFEKRRNGLIHYFENKTLGIRKFYLKAINGEEDNIEISRKIFGDFDALAEKVVKAACKKNSSQPE